MRRLLPIALALVLAACGGSGDDYTVEGDESFGGFARDATVARALELFGQPARREGVGSRDRCTLVWPELGIRMETFEASGTERACGPPGKHVSTTLTGARWQTSEGLKIGDPVTRVRELYPDAAQEGDAWVLATREFSGLDFPSLDVRVESGRVVSFTLYGPKYGF